MGEVVWTEPALADLQRIIGTIGQRAPGSAAKLTDRLVRAPRRLAKTPRSGAQVPEFERDDIREILVRPYRLIYVIREGACHIVAIVHGRRDLRSLVQEESFGNE